MTHIPQKFIADLENWFVPPLKLEEVNAKRLVAAQANTSVQSVPGGRLFTRVATAPASADGSFPRLFGERTRTFLDASLGLPREELRLNLAVNMITQIPLEMFNLQKLTILSLRKYLSYLYNPSGVHH